MPVASATFHARSERSRNALIQPDQYGPLTRNTRAALPRTSHRAGDFTVFQASARPRQRLTARGGVVEEATAKAGHVLGVHVSDRVGCRQRQTGLAPSTGMAKLTDHPCMKATHRRIVYQDLISINNCSVQSI